MNKTHHFTENVEDSPRCVADLGNTATTDPQRTEALYEEMNEAIAREIGTSGTIIGRLPEPSLKKAA